MESTLIQEKSTHKVQVIQIKEIFPHPNADMLELVKIWDYVTCIRKGDFKVGDLGAWVPPDSECDITRPEFSFLKDGRIKASKLRGIVSYGLLVHAPEGAKVGDNVAEVLNVQHWEPEIAGDWITSGDVAKTPAGIYPKYDVDAFLKYGRDIFVKGELVSVSEKVNGCNSRFVFKDGEINCGSRINWYKEFNTAPKVTLEDVIAQFNGDEIKAKNAYQRHVVEFKPKKNLWWKALESAPGLRAFCEKNPGFTVYGETYGQVKGFGYGSTKDKPKFAAFDILIPGSTGTTAWMPFPEFLKTCKDYNIPHVPIIHEAVEFDFDTITALAGGNTLMPAQHIREGVVVRPIKERWDERLGRVQLKIINPDY